ncbi:glycosyl hydrolase family 28 protein [Cohnella sp.]|uniref:glycosyl hydrolase family 28 protein n=1 Tax=Cohnella sp. TaxID=1883426 RepID=UPI0035627540
MTMITVQNQLITYPAPAEAAGNSDFKVRVRVESGEWQQLFCYNVKVDMHNVRNASMVYFDCTGPVEVEVSCAEAVEEAIIRPLSSGLKCAVSGGRVTFTLDRPRKLSLEINGDRFHNLHLFANPLEENAPDPADPGVVVIQPGIHRTEDLLRLLTTAKLSAEGTSFIPDTLYFTPGMHHLEEVLLQIPSGKTVYIAGGAVVAGSMVCERVQDVTIRGRGLLYLSDFGRFSAFRGVRIVFSQNISIEGIITVDPPHYTVYIGQSEHITIRNFKTFSTLGWLDGIDMMSSSNIEIDDVFLRTSDDCIAIYGHRWDFYGDARNVTVRNAILWADVAHPMMIGVHGDYVSSVGNVIENIVFENIDVLEHHEPQPDYWGCMAINAGDNNTVRNIRYENIRVEAFELGELFNIRVVQNSKYNPEPGRRVEQIHFKNISFDGNCPNPSRIEGFDEMRVVDGITIENVRVNGKPILVPESEHIQIGSFTKGVIFKK